MRLLVSVASAAEAAAALAGGADVIDAKDPHAGALGPVSLNVLRDIHAAVAGAQPVSAALGDAADEAAIERHARAFTAAGALFVKVGFAGITRVERIAALTAAAVRGARVTSVVSPPNRDQVAPASGYADRGQPRAGVLVHASISAIRDTGVIVVAYVDTAASPAPLDLVEIAARSGAVGVLLDTAHKSGPGLCDLVAPALLATWVAAAHDAGLAVALAGRLTADDLPFVRDAGADIAGVRGAACEGGRTGRVTADKGVCSWHDSGARDHLPPDGACSRRNLISKALTCSGCSCWTQCPAPSRRWKPTIRVHALLRILSTAPGV